MNYYNQIKELLISNEVYKKVKDYSKNKNDLNTYYEVGKLIIEVQGGEARAKYGDSLIEEYSKKLIIETNDKKYSERNLRNMRQFYLKFKDKNWNPVGSKLYWTHIKLLLPLKNDNAIDYYMDQIEKRNLSKRNLEEIIKNEEYERYKSK